MKLLKKITIKDCGLQMAGVLSGILMPKAKTGEANGLPTYAKVGPEVDLLQVMGIVSGAKPGSRSMPDGKLSEWLTLKGQFKATNIVTGEVFSSGDCILPGSLPGLIAGVVADDAVKSADFGVVITARYDESAIAKYVFGTRTLIEPKQSDAMATLEARIAQANNLLPAPADGETKPAEGVAATASDAKKSGKK